MALLRPNFSHPWQNLFIQNKKYLETLLHQANIVKNRIYKFYRKNSTHCVRGWTLVRSSLIPTNNIHLFIAPTKKRKTNDIEYPRSHIWSGYIQSKDFFDLHSWQDLFVCFVAKYYTLRSFK